MTNRIKTIHKRDIRTELKYRFILYASGTRFRYADRVTIRRTFQQRRSRKTLHRI